MRNKAQKIGQYTRESNLAIRFLNLAKKYLFEDLDGNILRDSGFKDMRISFLDNFHRNPFDPYTNG